MTEDNQYNFNSQDYDMTVRLYNGVNDVYLSNAAWDELFIEEDIFDWKMKGSIIIRTPHESLERVSDMEILASAKPKKDLVYKFRNDGRDTIFISIKPKDDPINNIMTGGKPIIYDDGKWRIELEAVIYDVEDMYHSNVSDKHKRLFFWEKTFQLMMERDCDFSTTDGKDGAVDQMTNEERSRKTGDAIGSLLSRSDFSDYAKNVTNPELWDNGGSSIFYTAPVGAKVIDVLNYLSFYAISEEHKTPCILKLERAEVAGGKKQFSLKSIDSYFQKINGSKVKDFQIEHFFLEEMPESNQKPVIRKSPLSDDMNVEFKGDQYNLIKNYQLVDLSGLDYSKNLVNYRVVSLNSATGQFNEEAKIHSATQYKEFFNKSIKPNVLTKSDERLPLTQYIIDGKNTKTIYSLRQDPEGRLADGRNRLLKYYLFNNITLSFAARGLTLRQPGRFFAVSKMTSNDNEHDSKFEGQYFVTNVIHHFSTTNKAYMTELIGVKTYTYKEDTELKTDDVLIT